MNWFLWRPCTGITNICVPLAKWSDMLDGTYCIEDVLAMNVVMDEMLDAASKAKDSSA